MNTEDKIQIKIMDFLNGDLDKSEEEKLRKEIIFFSGKK